MGENASPSIVPNIKTLLLITLILTPEAILTLSMMMQLLSLTFSLTVQLEPRETPVKLVFSQTTVPAPTRHSFI